MDKCILVKESEWNDYKSKSSKYDSLQEKYNELNKLCEELKGYRHTLSIIVETNLFEYDKYNYPHKLQSSIIENLILGVKGDSSIDIGGNLKTLICKIKEKIEKTIMSWLEDYVNGLNEKNNNVYSDLLNKEKIKYNKLLSLVEAHDKKCWFKKNRILK